MYGTIFRIRPRTGREQAVRELNERWPHERAPRVDGFVAEYLLESETHPGEWLGLVIFESKESYLANAEDPAQHRWYERFRALLEADPEWNDGAIEAIAPASVPL